jgi:SAM-dependent methyltransferase
MSDGAATFRTPPDVYERYMGVWSRSLARAFCEEADVQQGDRALDVGCGTGGLTAELARRLGAHAVAAIDPSEPAVEACAAAVPGADIRVGGAETLPFADGSFDLAMCQLVVNFMTDPLTGVSEMRRVTRADGTVAACTWDYRDGMTMLRVFWDSSAPAPSSKSFGPPWAYAMCGRAHSASSAPTRTSTTFGSRSRSGSAPAARTASHSIPINATRCVASASADSESPPGGSS